MKIFFQSIILVFLFSTNILSQCQEKILAFDGQLADFFGISVSIFENKVAIGAIGDDDNGNSSGSVYVYERVGTSWIETKLYSSDIDSIDIFGTSLFMQNDRLIVSAIGDDDNGSNSGSIYIFDWDGTNWIETKILPSNGQPNDQFGSKISAHGDRIVVGTNTYGQSLNSVYVFEWDGSSWIETILTASDGEIDDFFGSSISIFEDRIVVGARGDADNGIYSGSIYIYEWDGSTWVESKILASDGEAYDAFGFSVSIYENRIIASSTEAKINGISTGAAYIYEWDGTIWAETKINANDGEEYDLFGWATSIYKDSIIVSAFGDDLFTGSAYIFTWNGTNWGQTKISPNNNGNFQAFGYDVSINNGNVIVGSYADDENGSSTYYYHDDNYVLWYRDSDNDDYGNPEIEIEIQSCYTPQGYVLNSDDCDDSNGNIGTIGTPCIPSNPCMSSSIVQNNCLCEGPLNLHNNQFTGNGSDMLWINSSNWSLNMTPERCHKVFIPSGFDVIIPPGYVVECYVLEVADSSSLCVENGSYFCTIAK